MSLLRWWCCARVPLSGAEEGGGIVGVVGTAPGAGVSGTVPGAGTAPGEAGVVGVPGRVVGAPGAVGVVPGVPGTVPGVVWVGAPGAGVAVAGTCAPRPPVSMTIAPKRKPRDRTIRFLRTLCSMQSAVRAVALQITPESNEAFWPQSQGETGRSR